MANPIKKIIQNVGLLVGAVVCGHLLGGAAHKIREAVTRSKAMDAALRRNNGERRK